LEEFSNKGFSVFLFLKNVDLNFSVFEFFKKEDLKEEREKNEEWRR
jgi:hypothetical protein